MVLAVVIAGGTALSGVAVAEPEGDMSLANSPTLSLRTVGIDSTISLYGIEGQQTLSIPVQPGLVPTELVADPGAARERTGRNAGGQSG